jgi:hypothetical protein
MARPRLTEAQGTRPQTGEAVNILGFGIASQEAIVEASDGARFLLRLNSQEGLVVGTELQMQYVRDGDMYSAKGSLQSRTGNLWWFGIDDVNRVQRRQFQRIPVREKATLLLPNRAGGEDAFLVDLSDVSAGGCAFEHAASISEGSRVELRFRVSDGRVHVRAIVLECRGTQRGRFRVRARFDDVAADERERIVDWVVDRARQR